MFPAFIKGVTENLPDAQITFDKFNITKVINSAVDKVRKAEVKYQSILRGQKYIYLKNHMNLSSSQLAELKYMESMPKINLKTIRASCKSYGSVFMALRHLPEDFKDFINFLNGNNVCYLLVEGWADRL